MRKKRVPPASDNQVEPKEVPAISGNGVEAMTESLLEEIVASRHAKGLSQGKLQTVCGVQQAVIARMERGASNPQLSTVMKILYPLGMTLAVVPLYTKHNVSR